MNKFLSEFEIGDDKKYKIKAIQDSVVYTKKNTQTLTNAILFGCIKKLSKKKNTREPVSAIMYLWKIVSIFYKTHLEKLIIISAPLDFALPIAKPIVKFFLKWK